MNNSDSSLDIDPDEIDPELLEMAQRWAQQYQKPEDLPEDFKELIESLGAKLRDPEKWLAGTGSLPTLHQINQAQAIGTNANPAEWRR